MINAYMCKKNLKVMSLARRSSAHSTEDEGRMRMEQLKCGAIKKHIVIKIEDLKHINSVFKIAMLQNDLEDIQTGRKAEGKDPSPEYLVINTDEPYINDIIEILKANGHWG